jgi:hypothetical protein
MHIDSLRFLIIKQYSAFLVATMYTWTRDSVALSTQPGQQIINKHKFNIIENHMTRTDAYIQLKSLFRNNIN